LVHAKATSTLESCSSCLTAKRLRTQSGPDPDRRRDEAALNSAFNSASRDEPPARPAPRSSSRPAVSWTGLIHVRAKSRKTSRRFIIAHGIPARAGPPLQREPADALVRAVRVLPGNSATAERSFFPGRYSSLCRTLRPLRRYAGQRAFGSFLKGCSVRRAPPPRANIPLSPRGGRICGPASRTTQLRIYQRTLL
jgi:hypothetical protein